MSENAAAGTPPVELDLVAPEVYAPMLRRLAAVAAGGGLVAALVAALLVGPALALAVFVVIAGPTVFTVLALRRRRIWLSGSVIHVRTVLGERRVDAAAATELAMLVLPGRVDRVALRIVAGGPAVTVPLALYTGGDGEPRGRELPLLGLRGLADALAAAPLAAALAVSEVLVAQLRAEARDAPPDQRPLYRAVGAARAAGYRRAVVLGDEDIAALC